MKQILRGYPRRLLVALMVALWLRFLLIPTAWLFYELYHLTGVHAVYWGYGLFRAVGYYFGGWPYQTVACVVVAVVIGMPWREVRNVLESRKRKQELAL